MEACPQEQDEPVPVGPLRVVGVVVHDPRPQNVGQRGQGHGRPAVARVAFSGASMAEPRITLIPSCSNVLVDPVSLTWPTARTRALGRVAQQGHRRREPVDEVLPSDRSDLAGGEEAGEPQRSQEIGHHPGVMIRFLEQPRTPGRCR